jgi:arylsulfatase A-like enzyme
LALLPAGGSAATAPETTIDSGPSGPTNDSSPSFAFSSSDPGSSFECRLDSTQDSDFQPCDSPKSYSSLADGAHTFEVRAVDSAGNVDLTPASRDFTVDTAPPHTRIDSGPAGPTNDASPSFSFSASEPGSSFECRLDSTQDSDFQPCDSPKSYDSFADGPHSFDVRATDPVGNVDQTPASSSFTVDTASPETTIDSGPAGPTNNPTPTFAFSSSEPGSSFECRVDSGSYASCASPMTTPKLADGSHTFYVRASDPAGNADQTPGSRDFTVDTAPPDTTITVGPSGTTNNPTPTFAFSSSEPGSSFECRVDLGTYASCASPMTTTRLTNGSHTFRVRANDPVGNVDLTPASRSFTVRSAPNVLVIETDDQTVESMRIMKNVNALIGRAGTTFKNSFVNFSLCCPSRSTFLTGQYAHNHGVWGNVAPNGGFDRFEALHANNNLAVWLQDAGYYTALIGKYLNGYANDPPVPPGWSEWHAVAPDWSAYFNYTLNNNGTLVHYGQDPTDYKTDVETSMAVDFVNRQAPKAQPFFLWLSLPAPHVKSGQDPNPPTDCSYAAKPAPRHAHSFDSEPLPKPSNFNEADVSDKPAAIRSLPLLTSGLVWDVQRKYRCALESLLAVDEGVKRIIDALRANSELGNTLAVFTSDNGYFNGEHRIPEGKQRIYEESVRVPLEMRGPGIPQGVTVNDLTINADLAPTILQVATAASPGLAIDGRSLIPVAQSPGIESGRELLIEEPGFEAIRTDRYAYAEYRSGEKELYDLPNDPFEFQSHHDDPAYALVKSQLADQLHQLQTCAGSTCRVHPPPPPAPITP